jgi:hypothetical protein
MRSIADILLRTLRSREHRPCAHYEHAENASLQYQYLQCDVKFNMETQCLIHKPMADRSIMMTERNDVTVKISLYMTSVHAR